MDIEKLTILEKLLIIRAMMERNELLFDIVNINGEQEAGLNFDKTCVVIRI